MTTDVEHEDTAGVSIEQDEERVVLTFHTGTLEQGQALFKHLYNQLMDGRLDFHLHKGVEEQRTIIDA